jgi:MYXO-CTERM domain-containing protein
MLNSSGSFRWQLTAAGLAFAALTAANPAPAEAHFVLNAPACYSKQDAFGTPLKVPPCGAGESGNPVVPTGAITTYQQGQTIDITVNETIFHPGFYRVAIASDQAGLPPDPVVTPVGSDPCGKTTINPSPWTLPIVADGLLMHSTKFSNAQTFQVTLPPGLTCTNCVLQITEFMSSHPVNNPGGCFYHHCATVNIVPPADAGVSSDGSTSSDGGASSSDGGGSSGGSDASTDPPGGTTPTGCSCKLANTPAPAISYVGGLLLLGLLLRRRFRRA